MSYLYNGFGESPRTTSPELRMLSEEWSKMGRQASPIALSLASLASMLHALYLLHQSAHWQTRGPTYYADHLMFQRLYKNIDKEIDSLGERAVNLGGPMLVCPITTAELATPLLAGWGKGHGLDAPEKLVSMSLRAERSVLDALGVAMTQTASDGVQNLLQGIADAHEGNLYLLDQRLRAR